MNNKERILKKLLFDIFDKLSKGADVYNHNGSLWLINTDITRWIFEFTKSKTLWYNYNFFRSALKFVSLDVNEGDNQKYITEWFESRYLNINQVKQTELSKRDFFPEDIFQNGVKETKKGIGIPSSKVDDTIEKGVKEIQPLPAQDGNMDWGLYYQRQEDRTKPHIEYVRDVIEEHHHRRREVIVTIKDGVKETHQDCSNNIARVEGIIRVGEKLD